MSKRFYEFAFATFLFVGSLYFWYLTTEFPVSRRYANVDSDFWPKLVFGLLAILSAVLMIRHLIVEPFWKPGPAEIIAQADDEPVSPGLTAPQIARLAIMAGLILAYFFGLQYMGFVVATILFLFAGSFVLPYRRYVIQAVFPIVFTFGMALFFSNVLSLPLPRGEGVFYDFSLLLF
jgi:putative tricarboxylic transport membrane protein